MPRWFLTAYQEINNMHMVSTAIVTMVGGIENYYLQGLVIKIDRSKSLTHGYMNHCPSVSIHWKCGHH